MKMRKTRLKKTVGRRVGKDAQLKMSVNFLLIFVTFHYSTQYHIKVFGQ